MSLRTTYVCTALLVIGGCGGSEFPLADVSGKVTLNGEPLADAHVRFQPVASGESLEVGSGSVGTTNAQGEYSLRLVDPELSGAIVGLHQVAITLPKEEDILGSSGRPDDQDDAGGPAAGKYRMPQRYRDGTALEFEVTPEGTTSANFDLTSP